MQNIGVFRCRVTKDESIQLPTQSPLRRNGASLPPQIAIRLKLERGKSAVFIDFAHCAVPSRKDVGHGQHPMGEGRGEGTSVSIQFHILQYSLA